MTLVTFRADVFPHCKNDVVDLSADEKARVDDEAKRRNIETPYVAGDKSDAVVVEDGRDATPARLEADRKAAQVNALDQAAQLEAQRDSVAVPANTYALGAEPETPAQVVTGTEPAADVEVKNPQEATDPTSGKGADVKGAKGKELKDAAQSK